MAWAFKIEDVIVSNGTAEVRYTSGQTPLPSWEGSANRIPVASVDEIIAAARDRAERSAFELLVLRAHEIDPTHGAAFRTALVGKTLTFDPTINNMVVRTV